jgi:putative hydrolase of the HAD superfamily
VTTAVLLDALGTLVQLEAPWPRLVAELASRGVDVSLADARTALEAEMAYYRAHHDEAVDRPALQDLRDRCTDVLARALGPAGGRVPHDELRAALLAALHFVPYPEVPDALAALRARGRTLVVVSNWDISLRDVLARTGLDELVDHVVISAEVGAAKPDPEIFARALALAGTTAAQALHAGDSLEHDVEGALAAGIEAVLVDRAGNGAPAGVRSVRSLAELPGAGP